MEHWATYNSLRRFGLRDATEMQLEDSKNSKARQVVIA